MVPDLDHDPDHDLAKSRGQVGDPNNMLKWSPCHVGLPEAQTCQIL